MRGPFGQTGKAAAQGLDELPGPEGGIMRSAVMLTCVLIAGTAIGCRNGVTEPGPSWGLELRTDQSHYEVGDMGTLVLINGGPGVVGPLGALCRPEIERREGEDWVRVGTFDEVCGGPVRSGYPPGTAVDRNFEVKGIPFSEDGEYRIGIGVGIERRNEFFTVWSNVFSVSSPELTPGA